MAEDDPWGMNVDDDAPPSPDSKQEQKAPEPAAADAEDDPWGMGATDGDDTTTAVDSTETTDDGWGNPDTDSDPQPTEPAATPEPEAAAEEKWVYKDPFLAAENNEITFEIDLTQPLAMSITHPEEDYSHYPGKCLISDCCSS